MIIYVLIILIFALSFLPKIRNHNILRILNDKLHDFKIANSILLIWIILGFFTRLDFSRLMGDIVYGEKIFDSNNIGFSSISFLLILTSRLLKNGRGKITIILLEFLFWSFRYFYYKGGYAMGLGASYPNDLIVLYDFIALLLRLKLIYDLKPIKFLQKWRIFVIVILFITVKIFLFPFPNDMFWVTKRIQQEIEITKSAIIGDWSGIVSYDSSWYDTLAVYSLDTIPDDLNIFLLTGADRTHTDSTHTYALKEMKQSFSDSAKISIIHDLITSFKSPDCRMDYWASEFGGLKLNNSTEYGTFRIWKLDQDSLIITISEGFGKDYKYKLNRE